MALVHPVDDDPRTPTRRAARPLYAEVRAELSDDWIALHDPLADHPRSVRLQLPTFVLVGPPGIVCLQDATPFEWRDAQWWFAGHEAVGPWTGARRGEDLVRDVVASPARDLGGPDVVLGHGIVFAAGARPLDAPGDSFVARDPAIDEGTLADFVDRIVARGRVARRIDRAAYVPDDVRRLARLLDATFGDA